MWQAAPSWRLPKARRLRTKRMNLELQSTRSRTEAACIRRKARTLQRTIRAMGTNVSSIPICCPKRRNTIPFSLCNDDREEFGLTALLGSYNPSLARWIRAFFPAQKEAYQYSPLHSWLVWVRNNAFDTGIDALGRPRSPPLTATPGLSPTLAVTPCRCRCGRGRRRRPGSPFQCHYGTLQRLHFRSFY